MISSVHLAKDLLSHAEEQLRTLLAPLPLQLGPAALERDGVDLSLDVVAGSKHWTLICEVKANGQPRHIREAALQARHHAQQVGAKQLIYPVVVAPFMSRDSGAICQELGVGYADLAGNCRLAFDTVYLERRVATNPFKEKREQRSLFAPKSARVMRIMLGEPSREWKVADLAERAAVSYGQVSKVRKYLLEREWASGNWGGVRLVKPQALLESWKNAYKPLRSQRRGYHTVLHGEDLQRAMRAALHPGPAGQALLSSYSAARWLAPYARIAGEYFYADMKGATQLQEALKLEVVAKGQNITIDMASDDGVFQDSVEAAPALHCTGPIQTYLDLATSGERGEEAAQHLFETCIAPKWEAAP